jgi:anti-sigma regulatory factor (Ser/Thr protein kinase)
MFNPNNRQEETNMATVVSESETLLPSVFVEQQIDVNAVHERVGSLELAVRAIRKAISPVFEKLGGDEQKKAGRIWAAEEAVKNILHADETYPRDVAVMRCGGLAIRTFNRIGENGADLEKWMDPENSQDNGLGMRIIQEFADGIDVIPDGDMVECWFFFDGDREDQRFPRIHHDD